MSVTSMSRYKGGTYEQIAPFAKRTKAIHEKYGAEMVRLSRIYTGPNVGEWLYVVRLADWAAFGKWQEALAKDTEFQDNLAKGASVTHLTGRVIVVDADL